MPIIYDFQELQYADDISVHTAEPAGNRIEGNKDQYEGLSHPVIFFAFKSRVLAEIEPMIDHSAKPGHLLYQLSYQFKVTSLKVESWWEFNSR